MEQNDNKMSAEELDSKSEEELVSAKKCEIEQYLDICIKEETDSTYIPSEEKCQVNIPENIIQNFTNVSEENHNAVTSEDLKRSLKEEFFPGENLPTSVSNIHVSDSADYTKQQINLFPKENYELSGNVKEELEHADFSCNLEVKSDNKVKKKRKYDKDFENRKKCNYCEQFHKKSARVQCQKLLDHFARFQQGENYKCPEDKCEKDYKRVYDLIKHMDKHSKKEEKFICDSCGSEYATKNTLRVHKLIHARDAGTAPAMKCEFCPKVFYINDAFKKHMKRHSGLKDFLCSECGKAFNEKIQLSIHFRVVHEREKNYKCDCGKAFSVKNRLITHQKVVHEGERKFKCDICSKSFGRLNTLKSHQLVHTGVKNFCCEYCEKSFKEKRNLNVHIEKHHSSIMKTINESQ